MTQKGQHLMDVEVTVEAVAELQLAAFLAGRGSIVRKADGSKTIAKQAPTMDDFRRMASQALAAQATEGDGWEQVGFWKQKYEDKAVELQSMNDTFLPKYQTALNTVNTQATDSEKHRNDLYDKVMDQLATIGSQGRKIDAQATELAELRAENEALRKMTDPTWFYFGNDQSSDQCRFSVHEVIDEDFCWDNRKTGEHVIEIATAGPLPTIWAHVKFLTDEEKDAAETDEDYILTEFSTEEEARTLLAKHGGGDAG